MRETRFSRSATQRDFAPAARALRVEYDGSYDRFWEDFRSGRPALSKPSDALLLNTYAMAAAYSARDDGTVELPFELETGELIPEVWQRWLRFDPVLLARDPRHAATLRGLQGIWVDCGSSDEYLLELGATAFVREVEAAGVPPERIHFELFPGTHQGVSWRYPLSLAWLVERLRAPCSPVGRASERDQLLAHNHAVAHRSRPSTWRLRFCEPDLDR